MIIITIIIIVAAVKRVIIAAEHYNNSVNFPMNNEKREIRARNRNFIEIRFELAVWGNYPGPYLRRGIRSF